MASNVNRTQTVIMITDENSKNMEEVLRSQALMAHLEKVGDDIAKEVEGKYSGNGRGYKYKTVTEQQKTRGVVLVGTDHPKAPYSEAKHGHLLNAANKKRG